MADCITVAKLLDWSQSADYTNEYIRSLLLENLPKEQVDRIIPYDEKGWRGNEAVSVNDDELKKMGLFEPYEERKPE